MTEKIRTTIWLDPKLWKQARLEGLNHRPKPLSGSAVLIEALKHYLKDQREERAEEKRRNNEPNIRTWFDEYNHFRTKIWGQYLDPPGNLRAVRMSQKASKLISSRLNTYGLSDLISILYKVRWDDYLMGRGRHKGNGHRLGVQNILLINSKICVPDILLELDDPEVSAMRDRMGQIEEQLRGLNPKGDPNLYRARGGDEARQRLMEEHQTLSAKMEDRT